MVALALFFIRHNDNCIRQAALCKWRLGERERWHRNLTS